MLSEKLIKARKRNVPKLINLNEMQKIHELSKVYGFKIIEDASHAIGGRQRGNSKYSDIAI